MKITTSLLWAEWRALLQADDLKEIRKSLRGTYVAMGVFPSDDLIQLNAVTLMNAGHSPSDVLKACRAWQLIYVPEHKTRRPPLAGDLHQWLRPDVQVVDRAEVGAQTIMGAIHRFGYMQGEAARAALGETIWSVVQRSGGWSTLCKATPEGCTISKAQFKKSLESAYRAEESATRAAQLTTRDTRDHLELAKTSSTRRPQLTSIADIPMPVRSS